MNNFVQEISRCLKESKYSKALMIINDPKNKIEIKKQSLDLIPILFKNIKKKVFNENDDLKVCCEKLLTAVANMAEPEEIVLEFLQEMDGADPVIYDFILRLLCISLPRCLQNCKFIECSLVSVRSYLEECILSDGSDCFSDDDNEKAFYNSALISEIMNSTLDFYSFFVKITVEKNVNFETNEMMTLLSSRLIQLYDFFLPVENQRHLKQLSEIQMKMMLLVTQLIPDPLYLLQFLHFESFNNYNYNIPDKKCNLDSVDLRALSEDWESHDSFENISVYENNFIISNLGYSIFFSLILCNEDIYNIKIPLIYNPKYIFFSLVFLTISFFEKKIIKNGLLFLETLLNLLNGLKLGRRILFFQWHENLLTHLANLMIYSENKEIRQYALLCFSKYIEVFDYEARYLLFLNFRFKVEHSGTLGYLITVLKKDILNFLDNKMDRRFFKYYSGKLLYDIVKNYCFLANNEKTDLVENADQIISSLNLLRFLVLRDRENKTLVKNYIQNINDYFLRPLQIAIASSKEFYETKLEHCNKQKAPLGNKPEITINGKPLMQVSQEEQKNALIASVNAVDLINSLYLRVVECVNDIC